MATPHNEAKIGDIADIVLMPGDPLRAKFIAEHYLENAVMFNSVRNMLGYTGYYKGKRVSVMGSGMGMPSMGIYSYELFKFYNVEKIIRIGSCGSFKSDVKLYDIVLVDNAYTDSNYALVQNGNNNKVTSSSVDLTNKIEGKALEKGIRIVKGNVYSSDVFDPYRDNPNYEMPINNYKCIVTEMEAFALFHNAKIFNKQASCLLTVSDMVLTREEIDAEARETALTQMIELALDSI